MPVVSCDPLRVWSRLEVRPRQSELDQALQARIADPLWLLTRQWQFGEFHGSDTGSAVTAKIARRLSTVAGTRIGSNGPAAYDPNQPLEPHVEQLPLPFPVNLRAQIGDHLCTLLSARLPAGAPVPAMRAVLAGLFPIAAVPAVSATTDPVGAARTQLLGLAGRVSAALAGRGVDGVAFAQSLPTAPALTDLPATLVLLITTDLQAAFLGALGEFVAWFTSLYVTPAPGGGPLPAWNGATLEYDFALDTDRGLALDGTTSPSGRLDWYCFTVASDYPPVLLENWEVTGAIPRPVSYASVPSSRWWQLEDAAVSLADLKADSTDIVKIVVTEFALVFGNDWLVVPYDQPVGTLAQIGGIVVTDVFGVQTFISAATGSAGSDWAAWDLFSLSPAREGADLQPIGQHLFLPPVLATVQSGPDWEDVSLVRDDDANLVWGLEMVVPDGLGRGRDGTEQARRMTSLLTSFGPPEPAPSNTSADAAALRYVLGTSVPENWIPFVPVHKPQDTHAIRLQRAWTPRDYPVGSRVRPVTSVLAAGIDEADGTQVTPYYVNEEQVPRAGTRIRGGLRRARWSDGATVVWNGRQRSAGHAELASGLRFDVLLGPGTSDS